MEKITDLKSMKTELEYITDKTAEIVAFMSNKKDFEKLSNNEKSLIAYQQHCMNQYRRVLKIRIKKQNGEKVNNIL